MSDKGYTARVAFDDRGGLFVGIAPTISIHGDTVDSIRASLAAAVDDYLQDCLAQGVAPEKAASGKLMLRVPPEVHGKALLAAHAAGKSLNQWATEVLQGAVRL